jgi:hypothetical protein
LSSIKILRLNLEKNEMEKNGLATLGEGLSAIFKSAHEVKINIGKNELEEMAMDVFNLLF